MAQFTARGYGGYEDVVGSAPHSPLDGQHLDHLDADYWSPTKQHGQVCSPQSQPKHSY
jgi:hypothetical protein